ncbi:MAG: chemotaxis protein CheW [Acidobacteriota bacterium]
MAVKLFQFSVERFEFALPGEQIVAVLAPGRVREVRREAGGASVDLEGRRVPLWDLPAGVRTRLCTEESPFLRVTAPPIEVLLQVERMVGLLEVPEESLIPVPPYLFEASPAIYRGVIAREDRLVGVLDLANLGAVQGGRGAGCS